MARFYDDIFNSKAHHQLTNSPYIQPATALGDVPLDSEGLVRSFETSTVIVADNVCEYYFAENDKEVWWPQDFPCIAPPFPSFFIEMRKASKIVSQEYGVSPWHEERPTRWGALFTSRRIEQGLLPENFVSKWVAADPARKNTIGTATLRCFEDVAKTGGWIMHIAMLMEQEIIGGGPEYIWECIIGVDAEGHFVLPENKAQMSYGVEPHGWFKHIVDLKQHQERIAIAPSHIQDELAGLSANSMAAELSGYLKPMFLALSLMHCKNVERVINRPDKALQKARERRGKPPLCRYYTLRIDPAQTPGQEKRKVLGKGMGPDSPERIVRGHFAYYGIPHPSDGRVRGKLFGKYSGQFWIPKHEVGTAKAGVIEKDYEVKL